MEKGSQKTQAYPWICRGFLRTLDPQEIGADRDKNRSIQVLVSGPWFLTGQELTAKSLRASPPTLLSPSNPPTL